MKRLLHIDIETFCDLNVTDVGVYRHATHPSFKIILFAYRWDKGPIRVIDTYYDTFPGESIPMDVWDALEGKDDDVEIWAHNANFEHVCISTYYGITLNLKQWFCTMVAVAYLGLPLGLDRVAKVLGLTEQKDAKGKALIRFFCAPNVSRKKSEKGLIIINRPEDFPEKWQEFKRYNAQDVRTECEIHAYTLRFPGLPDDEREYWLQDQEINATGITIDVEFIEAAIALNNAQVAAVRQEIIDITGIDNPNSPAQLKTWLESRLGHPVHSIGKEYLAEAVNNDLLPDDVARVLELRAQGSKTSSSKYDTMLVYRCDDNRIRGLLQYYGANRTGRYAGRGVQVQNLKKTINGNLEVAKQAIVNGVADLLYDDVPDLISKLVRTAFIAAPGKSLPVSDFAAIEARILAWLAGEEWVLDVFNSHGKLYEATASKMFNVPIEKCGKGTDMRAKGKVASLALGYQGASGALITMGALREGLTEEELPGIVSRWRLSNPAIVKFWKKVEGAARHVIRSKGRHVLKLPYCEIGFSFERGYLFITLPSGRRLAYYGAHLENDYKIRYWGLDQMKKIWVKMDAYGGLLTENITQAIARDCLTDSMYRIGQAGVTIVMHIHDEIVAEADEGQAEETLKLMEDIMRVSPVWANGLPLEGDGYTSKYYRKD